MHEQRLLLIPLLYEADQLRHMRFPRRHETVYLFGNVIHRQTKMPLTRNAARCVDHGLRVEKAHQMRRLQGLYGIFNGAEGANVNHHLLARGGASRAGPLPAAIYRFNSTDLCKVGVIVK